MGSSAAIPLLVWGRPLRWVGLAVVCGLALAYAALRPDRPRLPLLPFAAAAGYVLLALDSSLWSVDGALTARRAVAFGLVMLVAVALAHGAAGEPRRVARLLTAVFTGVVLVGIAGAVVLAVDYDVAVVHAAGGQATRYRGLGENPNTVPLLNAIALPIGVWLAVRARGLARAGAAAGIAVLFLSTVFADSRGAYVAALVAVLLAGPVAVRGRRGRAGFVVGAAAIFAVGIALSRLPDAPGDTPAPPLPAADQALADAYPDLACVGLPPDVAGQPPCGADQEIVDRAIVGDSGRLGAWRDAVGQVGERPLVGYGFGTEEHVFVDRSYVFLSDVPENSYLGVLLQLGLLGLAVLLALVASALAPALRRGLADPALAATCAAAAVAGLVLGLSQSYFTAAGNVATLPFWVCLFLVLSAAAPTAAGTRAASAEVPAR